MMCIRKLKGIILPVNESLMTEFGLSQLELKTKKVRKTFFTSKKIGTIEKF